MSLCIYTIGLLEPETFQLLVCADMASVGLEWARSSSSGPARFSGVRSAAPALGLPAHQWRAQRHTALGFQTCAKSGPLPRHSPGSFAYSVNSGKLEAGSAEGEGAVLCSPVNATYVMSCERKVIPTVLFN